MPSLQKQVGKRVRELRENKGISQEALAAICNLHRTYVGLIERGERNLSLSTLETIAQGLEVPVSELFAAVKSSAKPVSAVVKAGRLPGDVEAHIRAIREILIDAKLTDAKRYDALYKA